METSPAVPPSVARIRALFLASGISVTGDGVLTAAAPLLAAHLSQNALEVAAVSAAAPAAWLLLGLPVGALVDRSRIRLVMVSADIARAVALLTLVALLISGQQAIWILVAAVFLLGIGGCFFDPAAQAMILTCAGKDPAELKRVNARFWSIDTLGRSFLGPILGASLFSSSRALPFLADALSFAVSAALVGRLPHGRRNHHEVGIPIARAVARGVRVLRQNRPLRIAAFGMTVYNLGWGVANATLVLYATMSLSLTGLQFGGLLALSAVGGAVGGQLHERLGETPIGRVYTWMLALQSAAWLAVGIARSAATLALAMAAVGFANTLISTAGAVTRQRHAPFNSLGRVVAGTRVAGIGAAAVGSLVGGLAATKVNLLAPFYVSAVALALSAVIFAWFTRGDRVQRDTADEAS